MIAEKLKKSILQAAIQGKLTEQLPEDGDARDLLKEIQKEKARLIKEGKIKKEKPFPEISEEEIPFDIPDNWVWCKINDIAFVTKLAGFEYTKYIAPNLCGAGIPLFKGKNIQNGNLVFDFESYIPDKVSNILLRSQLNKKCLLTPYVGTIGNIAIFDGSFQAHLGSNVGKIEIYNNFKINVLEEYLLLFLLSSTGLQQLSKYKKATAQESISIEAIRDAIICLPPVAEQNRIVERIESLLPQIDELKHDETKLATLQKSFPSKMKDSILQYAIQGRLTEQLPEDGNAIDLLKDIQKEKSRLIKEGKIKKEKPLLEISEDEIPFDIPDNWCWVRLGEVVLQNVGGGTPSKSNPNYWNGGIPWASVKDLNCTFLDSTLDNISEAGLKNSSSNFIPKGNLIVCTRMGLGKIVYNNIDVAINQDLRALLLPSTIDKWYVYYFYLTLNFTGKGATVKGISLLDLSNTLFPLPPLSEQNRIVQRLEEILPLCETLE